MMVLFTKLQHRGAILQCIRLVHHIGHLFLLQSPLIVFQTFLGLLNRLVLFQLIVARKGKGLCQAGKLHTVHCFPS